MVQEDSVWAEPTPAERVRFLGQGKWTVTRGFWVGKAHTRGTRQVSGTGENGLVQGDSGWAEPTPAKCVRFLGH